MAVLYTYNLGRVAQRERRKGVDPGSWVRTGDRALVLNERRGFESHRVREAHKGGLWNFSLLSKRSQRVQLLCGNT